MWKEIAFEGIHPLLSSDLIPDEVFYFASPVHLRFVHIHSSIDANGRMARLLEKYCLLLKNQQLYCRTINPGENFYELDYGKCMIF